MMKSIGGSQLPSASWKTARRGDDDRRGAALVEMALVLPIFFLVVLGIIEFGRAMMVANMVTNAAREGARLAILDGSSNAEVETAIRDFLSAAAGVEPGSVTVTITITPFPGNDNPGGQLAATQARDLITVDVSIPFEDVQYVTAKWLQGKHLTGSSAMRHE